MENNKLSEEWKIYKIGEVCKTTQGVQIPISEQILHSSNGYRRYLYINDFKDEANLKYVKDNYDEKVVTKNDLVMANTGSPGAVFRGVDGILSNNLFKISFDNNKLLRDYLFFYLSSQEFQNVLQQKMKGGIQKHLGHKTINNQNILIPSMETQGKIINVLERAENALKKRKESIKLLDELVKSQFIEMFGNPAINSKGWIVEELSKCLVNIENGKSFVCENYSRKGEYPAILKLSAVTYGIYNSSENKSLTDEALFVESVEVKNGDLLFTRKNTPELVGMSAYVYKTSPNLMMPDLIFRLNTNERCNKVYLWKLINHDLFRENIKALSNGSAKSMSNISKQRLMNLNIPMPPIELQNQFADFVNQIDKLKFETQKSLEEMENNFNSLMQKAFKGELFN